MLEFLKDLIKEGIGAIVKFVIAFGVGTGAGAVICWYYGIPLGFSVIGVFSYLGLRLH
jgi:hypothetical protein